MTGFLLRRLAQSVVTLLAVSIFAFGMIHLVPGDPVTIALGEHATPELVAQLRHQLGLDQSLYAQYLRFVGNALHGDLGTSIRSGQPVSDEIISRVGSTIALALGAMALAVPLGV